VSICFSENDVDILSGGRYSIGALINRDEKVRMLKVFGSEAGFIRFDP